MRLDHASARQARRGPEIVDLRDRLPRPVRPQPAPSVMPPFTPPPAWWSRHAERAHTSLYRALHFAFAILSQSTILYYSCAPLPTACEGCPLLPPPHTRPRSCRSSTRSLMKTLWPPHMQLTPLLVVVDCNLSQCEIISLTIPAAGSSFC